MFPVVNKARNMNLYLHEIELIGYYTMLHWALRLVVWPIWIFHA